MTARNDFTDEEWELVSEGPATAGMFVLTASGGGSFRESWAMAKTYAEARKQHGESELLDELVAHRPATKRYSSAEELEQQGLGRLREAVALLEQKASADEVEGYRRFVQHVATNVAEAHKEHGASVSAEEREAVAKVEASLA